MTQLKEKTLVSLKSNIYFVPTLRQMLEINDNYDLVPPELASDNYCRIR